MGCFRMATSKWQTCGNSQKALGLGEMMGSRLRAGLIEVGVLMSLPGRPHLRQYHPNTHWCVLSTPRYLERRKPPPKRGVVRLPWATATDLVRKLDLQHLLFGDAFCAFV